MTPAQITNVLRDNGTDMFRSHSYNHKRDAQHNLGGRTHYVDDNTLRHFKARIVTHDIQAGGLVYWIIESLSLNPDHTKRGFRYVAFDVYGTVLSRVTLDEAYKTSNAARTGFWAWFEGFNVSDHYRTVFTARADRLEREAAELRAAMLVEA